MLKNLTGRKCLNGLNSQFCAVLGAQWGDEGKGKLIDILANKYDIVARFNGGANAGHTIKVGEEKYFFHLIPSGMLQPNTSNIIGNGCVLSPFEFMKEIAQLENRDVDWKGRLFISGKAHLTLEGHMEIEAAVEESWIIRNADRYHQKRNRLHLRFEVSPLKSKIRGFAR